MSYLETVQELLAAKEGNTFNSKKPKIGLILEMRRNAAVLWRTMAAVSWYSVLRTKDPVEWSEVRLLTNRNALVWA